MPENSLQCCQSNGSLSSSKDEAQPLNNNDIVPETVKSQYVFPKRQKVDLEFNNVTFSSSSWSVTKFQKGMCLLMVIYCKLGTLFLW